MKFVIGKQASVFAAIGFLSCVSTTWAGNTDAYCYDDPYYVYQGKYCDDIADKGFCDVALGNGDIIGEVYCPVSCDACHTKHEESYLHVTKDCFEYDESIEATFANIHPDDHDAVAIYPIDEVDYDKTPDLWKWLCKGGHDGHYCKCYSGTIIMDGETAYGAWPLPENEYKIVIKRAGPYKEIVASDTFKVGGCGGGGGYKPTPKPVGKPVPAPTESPTKYPTKKPTPYPSYKVHLKRHEISLFVAQDLKSVLLFCSPR